ncbi:hypothetical protein [Thalassolituus maritimus]|uniref:Uncharacterized protein n=1 Tax=Thalassolituus maritimus TaxID=484498 RepID=A0ABQ0A335_9GAMM
MKQVLIIVLFVLCVALGLFLSSVVGYFFKPFFIGYDFLFLVVRQFLSVFFIVVPVLILARYLLRKTK